MSCPFSSARLASFPADANRFPASVFPWRCSWYNKCGVRTTLLVVFVGFPFPGLGIGERRVCGFGLVFTCTCYIVVVLVLANSGLINPWNVESTDNRPMETRDKIKM
jgi:hypothetical protein